VHGERQAGDGRDAAGGPAQRLAGSLVTSAATQNTPTWIDMAKLYNF